MSLSKAQKSLTSNWEEDMETVKEAVLGNGN